MLHRRLELLTYLVMLAGLSALVSAVPFTAPSGDLNLDGDVNSLDIQCQVLLFEQLTTAEEVQGDVCSDDDDCAAVLADSYCGAGLAGQKICRPGCLGVSVTVGVSADVTCTDPDADDDDCLGLTQKRNADLNCDGAFGNEDLVFLVAVITGKVGFQNSPDHDGDGQLNFCDADSDDDGLLDFDDCVPLSSDDPDCQDTVECTVDSCAPGAGCVYVPQDDLCDDQDPCTDNICDPVTGCLFVPAADGTSCGESPNDQCVAGECACVPDCAGRVCGDGGCGESCGDCYCLEGCVYYGGVRETGSHPAQLLSICVDCGSPAGSVIGDLDTADGTNLPHFSGLVEAGGVLYGIGRGSSPTQGILFTIDKATGQASPQVIAWDSSGGQAFDLAVSPDGRLYTAIASYGPRLLYVIDPDTMAATSKGEFPFTPAGVEFDENGVLHVVDIDASRLVTVDPETAEVLTVVGEGQQLSHIRGLAYSWEDSKFYGGGGGSGSNLWSIDPVTGQQTKLASIGVSHLQALATGTAP